jgi:hypothetical protein
MLCLSLSLFAVARAMKPRQILAAVAKTAQKEPTGQRADARTHREKVERFCLSIKTQPVRPEPPTLTPYNITYAKSPHQYLIVIRTGRVFILVLITGQSPWPGLLDLLVRVRDFDDCGALEDFHKSRTTRLGINYSNSKHLLLVQGRRPARLVGNIDVHSIRKSHHLDHSLHRHSKKLRKGRRFWNWFAFAADYFLSDPWFRQRAISRPFGVARGSCYSAAAACLGLLRHRREGRRLRIRVHAAQGGTVVPNTLTGPRR